MFLTLLKGDEKKNFLELVYYVAEVDGDLAIEEQNMLDEYRREMGLLEADYEIKSKPYLEIVEDLAESDQEDKNAMFIEMLALIRSDNKKFDDKEKTVVKNIQEQWNISDNKYHEMMDWLDDLEELYVEATELIKN